MELEDEEEDEEVDDEEADGPPKGGLGVKKQAEAQKEKAAKWARDNLRCQSADVVAGIAAPPSGGKKMSALDLAKEEVKRMQKEKLEMRVSKLKSKK